MSRGAESDNDGTPAVKLKVEFDVILPGGIASEKDVDEWLAFQLGASNMIRPGNPLAARQLKAESKSVSWQVRVVGVLKKQTR